MTSSAATENPPWQATADGLRLAVKVSPRASREGIEGIGVDAAGAAWLQVATHAVAEGGKANSAVIRLLAKSLGVPKGAIDITGGAQARWKRLHVAGDPKALAQRLTSLIAG